MTKPIVHRVEFRVCDACVNLEGEECHTPECVFCLRSTDVARRVLDDVLVCPIVNGDRMILIERPAHPEDFCERCGRKNVVWFAPSPLWNRVARDPKDGHDPMLCPVCFIELAELAGVGGTWRVAPLLTSSQIWMAGGSIPETETRIAEGFEILKSALKADPDYARGWHDNLACCALDEKVDHETANAIAARFMNLCFDVMPVALNEAPCVFKIGLTTCGYNEAKHRRRADGTPMEHAYTPTAYAGKGEAQNQ